MPSLQFPNTNDDDDLNDENGENQDPNVSQSRQGPVLENMPSRDGSDDGFELRLRTTDELDVRLKDGGVNDKVEVTESMGTRQYLDDRRTNDTNRDGVEGEMRLVVSTDADNDAEQSGQIMLPAIPRNALDRSDNNDPVQPTGTEDVPTGVWRHRNVNIPVIQPTRTFWGPETENRNRSRNGDESTSNASDDSLHRWLAMILEQIGLSPRSKAGSVSSGNSGGYTSGVSDDLDNDNREGQAVPISQSSHADSATGPKVSARPAIVDTVNREDMADVENERVDGRLQ